MSQNAIDPFGARDEIDTALGRRTVYRLGALERFGDIDALPYCIRVLLEACLRHCDGRLVTEDHVRTVAAYDARSVAPVEVPFRPGRIILQDFTGVPAVVDLAAMRDAIVELTGDEAAARKVNPLVPCDLICDHSVQVDAFATPEALDTNNRKEFERNDERYRFLKWGQGAFDNFRVVPPATGIVHQVNLEYLAKVVWDGGPPESVLYPDSLLGTDSHTTMINGLGVVGWGVGGIEAEAVMLGQPVYMLLPEVVGVRLIGALPAGATATDLVLRVTQMLREYGVVGKFVEFFGAGLAQMPLADRATVANMAPEYGATMGFFPVDEQTIRYLRLTGRDDKLIETVEQYCKLQGLWRDDSRQVRYTDVLELDMSTVEPSLAGPKRPQDRIELGEMKRRWQADLDKVFGKTGEQRDASADVEYDNQRLNLKHGDVCIASITSCTNTSNPSVLIAAGLLAKKADQLGLKRKPWVKSSLAPGSKVVTEYLRAAGLLPHLEALGFHVVGYGCATCIGNSGPLPESIREAINDHNLVAAAVLSGNRNFEGRVNPDTRANYLASPPLVVAYALAGTVDIDLSKDAIGVGANGEQVFLKDIWPTRAEIDNVVRESVSRGQFVEQYADVFEGPAQWRAIETAAGVLYQWDAKNTYIQKPPFFESLTRVPAPIRPIVGARVLCKLGDSVTTDHISPAGTIGPDSPAGRYLIERGVAVSEFNSFGSRRGNDRVMTRGTFGNIRIRNQLAPGTEGGWTKCLGAECCEACSATVMSIYDAAMKYRVVGTPVIVLAGKDYGMGSSRDWAAKGAYLLGVRAVIAESFERIHRSNLVGMGVLPLTFQEGQTAASLGLSGSETYDIVVDDSLRPRQGLAVKATTAEGQVIEFNTTCRVDTPVEVEYYRNGGILHTVLRKMAAGASG
jgi:aconitate hydratase